MNFKNGNSALKRKHQHQPPLQYKPVHEHEHAHRHDAMNIRDENSWLPSAFATTSAPSSSSSSSSSSSTTIGTGKNTTNSTYTHHQSQMSQPPPPQPTLHHHYSSSMSSFQKPNEPLKSNNTTTVPLYRSWQTESNIAAAAAGVKRVDAYEDDDEVVRNQEVIRRISEMRMMGRGAADVANIPEWKRQLIEKKRNKKILNDFIR
jgi:hypothetical protein